MTEVRGLFADRICIGNIKVKSNFVCDCRQMQHRVGRTAKCHIHRQCVDDGFLCHDVSRTDVLAVHIHDSHTCMLGKFDSLRINSRDRTIATKSHTKSLSQTVHRVSGIHTGAGTAGRADLFFIFFDIILCHSACFISTDSFKHG